MEYWNWNPSLDTGIPEIDSQHRKLLDYVNVLNTAIKEKDNSRVGEVLVQLTEYAAALFEMEERLMDMAQYPYAETHKRIHQDFIRRIANYHERHEQGEDVSKKVMYDLKIWMSDHIARDDKAYAPYIQKVLNKGWISKLMDKVFGSGL